MTSTLKNLAKWPRHHNGKPILKDTGEAFFFAQLIFLDKDQQKILQFFRDDCYFKLKHIRENKHPDLDAMFALVVEAQLYRECLDECIRIANEPVTY